MRAIVLHGFAYTDASKIVRIYTADHGLRSYVVRGIGKRSKGMSSLLHPLSLIDLTASERQRGDLFTIKEVKRAVVLHHLPIDPFKGMIAMYIAELLEHCLAPEQQIDHLFDSIWNTCQLLDLDDAPGMYALIMTGRLIRYLGVAPDAYNTAQQIEYLDLRDGQWRGGSPLHSEILPSNIAKYFSAAMQASPDEFRQLQLKRTEQRDLLQGMAHYLRLHINDRRELRSLKVLAEVFA